MEETIPEVRGGMVTIHKNNVWTQCGARWIRIGFVLVLPNVMTESELYLTTTFIKAKINHITHSLCIIKK